MAIFEPFRIAIAALWANKLRAILTMLGVIIGVASVIIMVSIVQGARGKVISQFEGIGSNLIFAFYAPQPDAPGREGYSGLTMDDITEIEKRCDLIYAVSPVSSTSVTARHNDQRKQVTLTGVLAAYPQTHNIDVAQGRFVNAYDDDTIDKACVIGRDVNRKLFGDEDAIGQRLDCVSGGSTVSLVVVGVLAEKDRGPGGEDFIDSFSARALDTTKTQQAADQIWGVLKQRHPIVYRDFIVDTQEGLLKQVDKVLDLFQFVLGGIGGLSLLTGGIGIMNIMLVSVTERTREIGIRKAVGARRGDILWQFLVEAMVVSGLGGTLGIAFGWLVSATINHFAGKLLPTYVPIWAAALGFGFSVGVGIFFGLYPAFRASKLDPIEALRHE
jgi:putative ABC transport system permease protein